MMRNAAGITQLGTMACEKDKYLMVPFVGSFNVLTTQTDERGIETAEQLH